VLLRRGAAKARGQISDISTCITNNNVLEKSCLFPVKNRRSNKVRILKKQKSGMLRLVKS